MPVIFTWYLRKKARYICRNHWFTCDFTNRFATVCIDFAQLSLKPRTPPVCPLLFTSLIKVLFDESASTHLTYCHVAYNSKYWGQNLFDVVFRTLLNLRFDRIFHAFSFHTSRSNKDVEWFCVSNIIWVQISKCDFIKVLTEFWPHCVANVY